MVRLEGWVAFSVKSEGRVVFSFDQPVPSLVAVAAPGVDGEGLIEVVIVTGLFVGFFDDVCDYFGTVERPEDECFQEGKLRDG